MDHVTPTEPVAIPESDDQRKPWQPLGYEKIDAADAEANAPISPGSDGTLYS